MNKLVLGILIAAVLFLGPLFAWSLIQDYAGAAREQINEAKPPKVKLHQTQRQIEEGNHKVGKAKAQIVKIRNEQARLQELMNQAPMPLSVLEKRHAEMRALVIQAERSGQHIRFAGQDMSASEMRLVLVRQRAYLESIRHYQQALRKLAELERRLESMVLQARHERAIAEAELKYARTLTQIASTVDQATGTIDLGTGIRPYGNARDVLVEVIAVQESRLELDEPHNQDSAQLFKKGEFVRP